MYRSPGLRQFSKEIPSLNVASVAFMNCCSSIRSRRWNERNVGMDDSPTPTVPISSDSIRVTSTTSFKCCVRAAAVIQPAVPPPAMTILGMLDDAKADSRDFDRGRCPASGPCDESAIQMVDQHCAKVPRHVVGHFAQHTTCGR